ncbi:MAG: heavy-metal-associated domain-containing protein, partial [Candidatus Odinarchaeia archaeon]
MGKENKITVEKIPFTGINCPKCRMDLEMFLSKTEGIKNVKVDYMTSTAEVEYDYKKIDLPKIEEKIENFGYKILYKNY